MKLHSVLFPIAFFSSVLLVCQPAFAIKKCQDADGNWHYGDVSVDACENSKITTLDDRGFITEQDEAPKTDEEIRVEEEALAAEEAERTRLRQEQDEQSRILSIYETEADIDRLRDNQLNSVQGNIVVHEAYLKSMKSRIDRIKQDQANVKSEKRKNEYQVEIDQANARVDASTLELADLRKQKISIIEKFKKEKEVYLDLKNAN